MNDKHRFLVEGTVRPSYVHFLGNHCHSQVDGSLLVHLQEINESYNVTFPSFGVTGLLIGKTRIGYTGTMTVQCPQTGLRTTLELSYPNKQKDSTLTGDILNQQKSPIFNLSGKWTGDIFITDLRTGVKSVFFSPTQYPIARPISKWKDLFSPLFPLTLSLLSPTCLF
jgi:hypothetical protein